MENFKKSKDLAARILMECEKEELSIKEIKFLLTQLDVDIRNSIGEQTNPLPFKAHVIR